MISFFALSIISCGADRRLSTLERVVDSDEKHDGRGLDRRDGGKMLRGSLPRGGSHLDVVRHARTAV
jgi:hypothetical protein